MAVDHHLVIPYACLWLLIIVSTPANVSTETYNPSEFEDKLGVAYEFKVHVEAGREDCFYQNVQAGASLYVAFQVMRGGDGQAGFAIRNPHGAFVVPYIWKQNHEYDESSVQLPGYYQMCIDNTPVRFASKLVSLYVATFKRDEWEKYVQELSDHEVTVSNFTNSLKTVDQNIGTMLKSLDHSRRQNSHDWYIVDSNNRYIQNWSLTQCTVIIISSVIQVFFVRKLFESRDTLLKGKPRA